MSLHKNPDYQIPELIAALKSHGLKTDTPSQLSDAFRTGWAAARMSPPAVAMGALPLRLPELPRPDIVSYDEDREAWVHSYSDEPMEEYATAAVRLNFPGAHAYESHQWQSIETAPKDGKSILLFTAAGQVEAYWAGLHWEQAPCYATYDGGGRVALTCQPTHWRPLEAAPETPEGKK